MKTILTPIGPTDAARDAGRHVLTPEMNASVAARHSRTDEGLDGILEKVEGLNQDEAVDVIFKHMDYGHKSIQDMIPISIHLEGISIWLAQWIWSIVQVGGGQESSTRYLRFDRKGVMDPLQAVSLGKVEEFEHHAEKCFDNYKRACTAWGLIAEKHPEVMRLPADADEKMRTRLQKNYVFDRARYFLPVAALTNMNVTTWAREWVEIVQNLDSCPWQEARELAERIRGELVLIAPRVLKYAVRNQACVAVIDDEIRTWVSEAIESQGRFAAAGPNTAPCWPHYSTFPGLIVTSGSQFEDCLQHRANRYDPVGRRLKQEPVQYGWSAVAIAEIRDMNRHRPGEKEFRGVPKGFYSALDQIPFHDDIVDERAELESLFKSGYVAASICRQALCSGDPNFIYWANLGTQFEFSHTNTMGKFVYELELRTGKGTHFRYRQHYQDLMEIVESQHPRLHEKILRGSGEVE